jgi:GNAT superfamily N-acetyltransferase
MATLGVRRASLADLSYVDMLRRRESESLGFLPLRCYEEVVCGASPRHRLWLAEVSGDPVGFLYASPGDVGRALRVIQVCLQPDARRIEYGTALVAEAESYARHLQRSGVACHVAEDIEARVFWDALGYETRGVVIGGARRRRVLEDRYKPLAGGLLLDGAA